MAPDPDDDTAPADDAVPTPVPPYEEAPSATGLVVDEEEGGDGDP